MNSEITQTEANRLFHYNPKTGDLTWRVGNGRNLNSGDIAGCYSRDYLRVRVNYKAYMVHRIIWLMLYGEWPDEIDHINGNKSDNRLYNLREVNREGNTKNASIRHDNSTGYTGVSWFKPRGCYRARAQIDGKDTIVGHFDNMEEAAEAVKMARIENNYTSRHGT